MTTQPIRMYRGKAAIWARLAASWLFKADQWMATDGRHTQEGLTMCLAAHGRAVAHARRGGEA